MIIKYTLVPKVHVGLLRSRRPFYVRCLWFAAWFGRVLFAIWRLGRQRVGRACVPEFVLCVFVPLRLYVCACVCVCGGVCACAHPGARAHAPPMQYGNCCDTHVIQYPRRVSNPHLPLTSGSPITAFADNCGGGALAIRPRRQFADTCCTQHFRYSLAV